MTPPRKQRHPYVALMARLVDPFGSPLGEGLIHITDESWYGMTPAARKSQIEAMAASWYTQPPYDADHGPPFRIEIPDGTIGT